jgi:Inorganic pyrophosphatase
VRAFGLLATIVSIFFVRGSETENPMNMLNRGYWVTTLLSVVGLGITTYVMMNTNGTVSHGLPVWVWFFGAGIVGLATSVAFVYITQFYTAGSYRPVREIAEASKTGPATNIISGRSASRRPSSPRSRSASRCMRATGSAISPVSSARTATTSAASSGPPSRRWAC